jgi:hypothetical protein
VGVTVPATNTVRTPTVAPLVGADRVTVTRGGPAERAVPQPASAKTAARAMAALHASGPRMSLMQALTARGL